MQTFFLIWLNVSTGVKGFESGTFKLRLTLHWTLFSFSTSKFNKREKGPACQLRFLVTLTDEKSICDIKVNFSVFLRKLVLRKTICVGN